MINVTNQVAYLRTTRDFPEDPSRLSVELSRSYIDIANCVNARTISIFTVNRPAINGESWYITSNQRQQGFRQVYTFDNTHLTITHGLNLSSIERFVRIWGTFYDGTSWQALPYVDVVAITNQIGVRVTPTQIIITKGATNPFTITNGTVILEWISQP